MTHRSFNHKFLTPVPSETRSRRARCRVLQLLHWSWRPARGLRHKPTCTTPVVRVVEAKDFSKERECPAIRMNAWLEKSHWSVQSGKQEQLEAVRPAASQDL